MDAWLLWWWWWKQGRASSGTLLFPLYPTTFWQIILALEEDPKGQKMQLACRLQQIAALVENKVTDL